jgi:hypothetical protein
MASEVLIMSLIFLMALLFSTFAIMPVSLGISFLVCLIIFEFFT